MSSAMFVAPVGLHADVRRVRLTVAVFSIYREVKSGGNQTGAEINQKW